MADRPTLTEEEKTRIGEETERRFYEALQDWRPNEPEWFLGVEVASTLLDMRGVDCLALVKYPKLRNPVRVPIQIKSSGRHIEDYFDRHRGAKEAGVIVLVIKQGDGVVAIRNKLFGALGNVRKSGIIFDAYLAKITRKPIRGKRSKSIYDAKEQQRTEANGVELLPGGSLNFLEPPPLTWQERLHEVLTRALYRLLVA
jgi:hypothetical protein